MNIFERIYWFVYSEIWPRVKVRGRFYWWCVRYGGKKRIPKEVIVGALAKSVDRMNRNLKMAQDAMPLDDMTEEERLAIRDMRLQAGELSSKILNEHDNA